MAINLLKGGDKHTISLVKGERSLLIHSNLNWLQQKKTGIFSFMSSKNQADLDLGCMYELQDGQKGVIQPLGNNFGSKSSFPYIFLDKDDRSGTASDGENMFVYKPELVKRIMFFGLIYSGAKDFLSVQANMFFKISNGEEVILLLDNAGINKTFCAAALIENQNGKLSIQKEAKYFTNHQHADQYYQFGFNWVSASKN
jgi:tellurite resistance protein TerA